MLLVCTAWWRRARSLWLSTFDGAAILDGRNRVRPEMDTTTLVTWLQHDDRVTLVGRYTSSERRPVYAG